MAVQRAVVFEYAAQQRLAQIIDEQNMADQGAAEHASQQQPEQINDEPAEYGRYLSLLRPAEGEHGAGEDGAGEDDSEEEHDSAGVYDSGDDAGDEPGEGAAGEYRMEQPEQRRTSEEILTSMEMQIRRFGERITSFDERITSFDEKLKSLAGEVAQLRSGSAP